MEQQQQPYDNNNDMDGTNRLTPDWCSEGEQSQTSETNKNSQDSNLSELTLTQVEKKR